MRISRSEVLEWQKCPRAWWWAYGVYGTGIQPKRRAVPLTTGSAVHKGIEGLLLRHEVEAAVAAAVAAYRDEVKPGLELHLHEEADYVVEEQAALVEALVRGFAAVVLPHLGAVHAGLIEREGEVEIGLGVVLQGRPDAILEDAEMGALVVLSLKTAAMWDARRESEVRHDDQGISELLVGEAIAGHKIIEGTQMVYLVKGPRKEYPAKSGRYVTWSPLIRGYKKEGIGAAEYASRYEWEEADPETGTVRTRRLGKAWQRVDMWREPGGIAAWIAWLAATDLELLEQQFVIPPLYWRREAEVASWRRQWVTQAQEIQRQALVVLPETLDECFPQHRRSCDWPTRCPFQDICWGGVDPADPLGHSPDVYEKREPNHPPDGVKWVDES